MWEQYSPLSLGMQQAPDSLAFECFGREKYTPKVFSALKTQVSQQANNRFGVYQKA